MRRTGLRRPALAGLSCLAVVTARPGLVRADAPDAAPAASSPAAAPAPPPLARAVRARKAKGPTAPSAAPANALLHVVPGALGTPWTFELTNIDATPLRFVTDGRLLSLELAPGDDDDDHESAGAHGGRPGAKKPSPTRCALPADLRPTTDGEHVRVMAPGLTYVETFDPRFYCFDGREAAALKPGARVVAHFGWPEPRTGASAPPFVVDATFGGDDRSGVKELTAEPITVPEALPPDAPLGAPQALVVSTVARVEAEFGSRLVLDVSLQNETSRPLHVMLRPETLAFEVASPLGVLECHWPRQPGAPIREVFTTVLPHGRASTNVLLSSMCPDAAFRAAGLYSVRARLDTREASGRSIGLETFDSVIEAASPTLVRIRRDRERRP